MPVAPALRSAWLTATGAISFDRPRIAGVLNVTPDSFWDGGRHAGADRARAHAERLVEEGADLLDVGGESTRPGAGSVSVADELERVLPVVRALVRACPGVPVSVDTVKAEVADAALAEGAGIINDVSGLRLDPAMGDVVARHSAGLVLMHSRGAVDPVGDVIRELETAIAHASIAGVQPAAIVLDPGLGFAKRTEQSIALLAGLHRLVELGYPVMVGPSRKRFIGDLTGGLAAEERLEGTLAVCVAALLAGARLFRVHDVRATRRALDVAEAIRSPR
jgi:dihydropteroate synthase